MVYILSYLWLLMRIKKHNIHKIWPFVHFRGGASFAAKKDSVIKVHSVRLMGYFGIIKC